MASSYKLELARFSTLLRIQDRAKCGKGGGHRTYLIEMKTLHIPYLGGDTAHVLIGWEHRT